MWKKGYEFFGEFNIFLKVNKLLNRGNGERVYKICFY